MIMITCSVSDPEFCLVGTASNFSLKKKGKVKKIELETPQGTFWLKIPHKLHKRLNCRLYPNVRLEARGRVKIHPKKAKFKLKLEHLKVLPDTPSPSRFSLKFLDSASTDSIPPEQNSSVARDDSATQKGKILICKKSPCWEKGGKVAYGKIADELKARNLEGNVSVKKTGCMDRCKAAPNLVVLPGKARYKRFNPKNVDRLIKTHFVSNSGY
jgi:(2Fe-2S) ferredoxin